MSLTKAELQIEGGDSIPCMFNPEQLTLSKSVTWASEDMPGRDTPKLTFSGGQAGTLAMDLWFDTTDSGRPVTDHTDKLLDLMKVDTDNSQTYDSTRNQGRPPWIKFRWGSFESFKAVLQSLTLTFQYFSSEGVPLRAKASGFTLTQVDPEDFGPQNPTSGTPYPHRIHQISPGETLDRIAATYYGDSTVWRKIAEVNGIVDPLDLRPGAALVIPEPGEVSRA